MTEQDLECIRNDVFAAATLRDSYHHGERHWRAVAHTGLELAPRTPGCHPLIVLFFALFHDAKRENEYDDPEHGSRGADLARKLLHGKLDPRDETTLYKACRDHTDMPRSDDPTVGVCWDADRLNLWRVGTRPDPAFLSTDAARDPDMIREAASFHDGDYDWQELSRHALQLEGRP